MPGFGQDEVLQDLLRHDAQQLVDHAIVFFFERSVFRLRRLRRTDREAVVAGALPVRLFIVFPFGLEFSTRAFGFRLEESSTRQWRWKTAAALSGESTLGPDDL